MSKYFICIIKISKNDYTNIEKTSAIFLSKFVDAYFHAVYNIKTKQPHMPIMEIETILNGNNIVCDVGDDVYEWYNRNRKYMTWDLFLSNKKIPQNIKTTILNKFDRSKEFNTHIIAINGYYQTFILGQKSWINDLYKKSLSISF